jgi:hypothetical protein
VVAPDNLTTPPAAASIPAAISLNVLRRFIAPPNKFPRLT